MEKLQFSHIFGSILLFIVVTLGYSNGDRHISELNPNCTPLSSVPELYSLDHVALSNEACPPFPPNCHGKQCPVPARLSVDVLVDAVQFIQGQCYVSLELTLTLPQNNDTKNVTGFILGIYDMLDNPGYQQCVIMNLGGNFSQAEWAETKLEPAVELSMSCLSLLHENTYALSLITLPRNDDFAIDKSFPRWNIPKYFIYNNTCLAPTPPPVQKPTTTTVTTLSDKTSTPAIRESTTSLHTQSSPKIGLLGSTGGRHSLQLNHRLAIGFGVVIGLALVTLVAVLTWKKKRLHLSTHQQKPQGSSSTDMTTSTEALLSDTTTATEPLLSDQDGQPDNDSICPEDSASNVNWGQPSCIVSGNSPVDGVKDDVEDDVKPGDSLSQNQQTAPSCMISDLNGSGSEVVSEVREPGSVELSRVTTQRDWHGARPKYGSNFLHTVIQPGSCSTVSSGDNISDLVARTNLAVTVIQPRPYSTISSGDNISDLVARTNLAGQG